MAIEVDATSDTDIVQSTDATWSHTCSGNDRFLLAATVAKRDNNPGDGIESVDYGGDALTLLAEETVAGSNTVTLSVWYLVAPAMGANTITFLGDASTNTSWACGAISYTGVNQTTPYSASFTTNAAASTDVSDAITSAAGEIVVDFVGAYLPTAIGVGAGQTKRVDITETAVDPHLGISDEDGAASVTMSWRFTTARISCHIGLSLSTAITARERAVKYSYDIYSDKILDDRGNPVQPWEIEPDNWIYVGGLFLPTTRVYDTFYQNPNLAYIEEVSMNADGSLRIKTDSSEFIEVMLARIAGRKTM